MKSVFMTGATGFLGSHFVKYLARNAVSSYCLVRGGSSDECSQRLQKIFVANNIKLAPSELSNINVVPGDIIHPKCGIDHIQDFPKIDTFWHFASSTKFEEKHRQEIITTNIDGLRHALDLALRLRVKRFVYISTAYVSGSAKGRVTESFAAGEYLFNNLYEESKFQAEKIATSFCDLHNIEIVVLRPSVVIGTRENRDSGGSTTGLYGFVREMKRLRKAISKDLNPQIHMRADPSCQVNFIPVDDVISDIDWLISNDFPDSRVFHLTSARSTRFDFILDSICNLLSMPRLYATTDEAKIISPLEKIIDRRLAFYSSYLLAEKQFDKRIPNEHVISNLDMIGYLVNAINELEDNTLQSRFQQVHYKTVPGASYFDNLNESAEETLFVVNAIGMPVDLWFEFEKRFGQRYRVVIYNSCISAINTDEGLDFIDAELSCIKEVISDFDLSKTRIIGWCTGAEVVLQFINKYNAIPKEVILLNGGFASQGKHLFTDYQSKIIELSKQITDSPRQAEIFHSLIYGVMSVSTVQDQAKSSTVSDLIMATDLALIHLTSTPFRTSSALLKYAQAINSFANVPTIENLANFCIPMKIISGDLDEISSPSSSLEVHKQIPASRYYNIKNADHFIHINNLDEFVEVAEL